MLFTARIEPPWLTRHVTTFRHVLLMRFKDDVSDEQIGAFFDGLASIPERSTRFGVTTSSPIWVWDRQASTWH